MIQLAKIVGLVAVIAFHHARAEPVGDEKLKSTITFIYELEANGKGRALGTGFFLQVPTTEGNACMLVTARHVLQDTNRVFLDQVLIRCPDKDMNLKYTVFPLGNENLLKPFVHDDPGVDIAVVPVAGKVYEKLNILMLPYANLATPEHLKKFKIREGDDMFFFGLFSPFISPNSNIPIFRFGKLAMLTDEKIPLNLTKEPQNYYLMETQAFGGNSGSPVFFHFDRWRNPGDTKVLLAGVMLGFFKNYSPIEIIESATKERSSENMGIALVTPAQRIIEIIESPGMLKLRGMPDPNAE